MKAGSALPPKHSVDILSVDINRFTGTHKSDKLRKAVPTLVSHARVKTNKQIT